MTSKLFQRGFLSLLFTQFFGVVNDNLLKQVLTFSVAAAGIWKGSLGNGGQGIVAMCLVLPFLLFSAVAGQLADKYSKQLVTQRVKEAEFIIALVALAGFWLANVWLCLLAMFLLGVQSAFFGPAKYGVIPELVDEKDLSWGNGIINLLTNVAAVLAIVVGGPLYERFAGQKNTAAGPVDIGEPMAWLPGVLLLAIAGFGLVAARCMPTIKAKDPEMKFKFELFSPYLRTLRQMRAGDTPILTVALLRSCFFMLAYIIILILADYTVVLGLPEAEVSLKLFGTIGVSIAVGSLLAGIVSRGGIQPRLVPIGAIGLTICFFLLAFAPSSYVLVFPGKTAAEHDDGKLSMLKENAILGVRQKRSMKRLAELRADLELKKLDGSVTEQLYQVANGKLDGLVLPAAHLRGIELKKEEGEIYRTLKGGGPRYTEAHVPLFAHPIKARDADIWRVMAYLFLVGTFAGLYVVPLQALIQKLSPDDARGRYIGTANAIDSVFEIVGILLFFGVSNLGMTSQDIFFIGGGMSLLALGLFYWKIRRHLNNPEWR